MIIANYMVSFTDLEEVWLVISPHNPLKEKKSLLADHHRLTLANLATEEDLKIKTTNIEFKMSQPSYTIDTLVRLEEKYPDRNFVLIAGSDILGSFHKWKNYQALLSNYQIYIYNRPEGGPGAYKDHPAIKWVQAPMMEISSSFIRKAIKAGKDIKHFLPEKVYLYIKEMHFYE